MYCAGEKRRLWFVDSIWAFFFHCITIYESKVSTQPNLWLLVITITFVCLLAMVCNSFLVAQKRKCVDLENHQEFDHQFATCLQVMELPWEIPLNFNLYN
ncbi:hypothetical protein L6452_26253 [Arctium lappa]|uniref:Uncharacterized protein n=1 Tax=Arctium lappa TaxID=4217 RepID=A0ACB9AD15_ARCLA|nr:hypothetical protein L6452_26253 [Arctium lappa]